MPQTMPQSRPFDGTDDQDAFAQRGISPEEAQRQWTMLTDPPQRVALDRPCTMGDGIERIAESERETLIAEHRRHAAAGRWSKFIPASGAATRMFALAPGDDHRRFCAALKQFAFGREAEQHLAEQGIALNEVLQSDEHDPVIDAVLGPEGLDYGGLPKGLVPFHQYGQEARTPFEEHLLESVACLSNADGAVRAHFTVSPQHEARFAEKLDHLRTARPDVTFDVDFSVQHPATDTIAMSDDGGLLRDAQGLPVFRPGGHGALLENLNDLSGDFVFVKNIDNVAHERMSEATVAWIQILGGYLARLQSAVHAQLRELRTGSKSAVDAARRFVADTFPGVVLPATDDVDELRKALIDALHRPLRVCGMVRNEGEPGGGPFWVRQPDGHQSPQIVEAAEVDSEDGGQKEILSQSTHFNPVFMALAVRDEQGEPFDLREFIDEDRAIITHKRVDGQQATVLERPGLWNGAMAHWSSVFVEVPQDVFSPVKTVFDLLRKAHQPHDGLATEK